MFVGRQSKKLKYTRLDNRTPEELAIEVRALRAEKQNLEKELREVKKGVGVGELLQAHAELKKRDSHMLLNLARAINKGVLDPDR
jgi:DNA repair exonuclease SbcCD ATPase subunit